MEHEAAAFAEPQGPKAFSGDWWKGRDGFRPAIILGLIIFFITVVFIIPTPQSMLDLVKTNDVKGAKYQSGTHNFLDSFNKVMKKKKGHELTVEEIAWKQKLCVAVLFSIAILWGTEAIPLGAADILIGVLLYLWSVLPINAISKAYMKDAVFFIFGVLVLAAAVTKTGLDRRIANLLLGKIRGLKGFCFIFFPLLAVIAGFLSEHALVALLCPILCLIYVEGEKIGCNKKQLHALAVTLFLGICFAANVGGSGSPAVGGRSAIMIGYFSEYDMPISFAQWVMYGMPIVPVLATACAFYIFFVAGVKTGPARSMDLGAMMKKGISGMGPLRGKQALMAFYFVAQVLLWIFCSSFFGLGGSTMIIAFLILFSHLMSWNDVQKMVRFDVVGLYAGACCMGVALKATGAAVWLATQFVGLLPTFFHQGMGIVLASNLLTTIMTNFMSDGATVGALGPVILPMAAIGNVHLWKVGLACSFGSSYAHGMIVGTVNNAIAYGMAKHPETGKQLISPFDFMVYGLPFVFISIGVLWIVAFFGYWQFLPWPV